MENSLEVKDNENIEKSEIDVEKSILLSIKKMLGVIQNDTVFDTDIKIHINSAFSNLNQLGVGPKEGYRISGPEDLWEDFIIDNEKIESVKTYVYLKVKTVFDPPLNGTLMESFKESIKELEWRLNVAIESE